MPAFATAEPSVLERLRQFDTPTICNVLELFDLPPAHRRLHGRPHPGLLPQAAADGRLRLAPPRSGPAARREPGTSTPASTRQVELFAASPGPAVVVFQDLDDPPVAATFGEVMCTTYQAFGAAGLITSGAGRDLDQVEALGLPVLHRRDDLLARLLPDRRSSTCRSASAA